jgi:anion-transporting  ArsA/GET3 family ATPase
MTMSPIDQVLSTCRVVVCVGSGGVGKTTTSALIAMHAAQRGQRALVMTIDPARRLANALGLDALDDEIQRIELPDAPGEMWATMLDMKRAFDEIVDRYAPDASTRDAIFDNRFYRFFSTSLAGAQELSASEKLYDVVASGAWDLVVLDTPPTTNALDFLDAPLRFFEALDSRVFQWAIDAGRRRGVLNMGARFVTSTLGRFTGVEFFEDLGEFLTHFSALFDGFRERTRATFGLFRDAGTRFVIVTSPDPLTVDEALYFRRRLDELDVRPGGVVVNRVRTTFASNRYADASLDTLADQLGRIDGGDRIPRALRLRLARKLLANAQEYDRLAARDRDVIRDLGRRVAPAPIVSVPLYANDVHDLEALEQMRADLVASTV